MKNRSLYASLKAAAKRFVVLTISIMVLFSLSQTTALAATATNQGTGVSLLALAPSSRLATQATPAGEEPVISEAKLDSMRENRRQWQSEASAVADTTEEAPASIGEVIKDKLNLDEIVEENEIVEGLTPSGR
ncbi:MAG: hypothetical protein WBG38_10825 [Nodosilinea sp.]